MKQLFLVVLALSCFGCGGGGSYDGAESDAQEPAVADSQKFTDFFGQDGNLWKPAGDEHGASPGSLTVLFSAKYATQFDSCEVTLNNGEKAQLLCINDQPWTQTPFSCFTNGDRQTWRANFGCASAGAVYVLCKLGADEYEFTVSGPAQGQVCSRFG